MGFIAVLAGCASGKPPLHQELGSNTIRVGVVLSFFEKNGIPDRLDAMAAASLETALSSTGLMDRMSSGIGRVMGDDSDEVHIQLLTRDRLKQVMQEQRLQTSGVADADQMVALGKVAGLQVVVTLEPTSLRSEEIKFRKGERYCVQRTAYAGLRIAAIRVDTGAIVVGGYYEGDEESSDCDTRSYRMDKLEPADMLIRKAAQEATESFASDFRGSL